MSEDLSTRLSRWSQRKHAARRGVAADDAPVERGEEARTSSGETPDAEEAQTAAHPAAEETPPLPPVEELNAESDYTVFLADKVPEAIRRAALRKLWTSDPVLANLDGLNNYDEDYNVIDTPISALQTAYKAGKGYVDEAAEMLSQAESGEGGDVSAPGAAAAAPRADNDDQSVAPVDESSAAARQVGEAEDDAAAGGSA